MALARQAMACATCPSVKCTGPIAAVYTGRTGRPYTAGPGPRMLGGCATLRADLAAHKAYQSTLYSTLRFYAIFHATLRADLAAQQARLALLALHLGHRPITH